jgi:hypothetical protein
VDDEFVEEWVSMGPEALVTYLTTQSGAVAAIEAGQTSLHEMEAFLRRGLRELLPPESSELRFGGPVFYLQRQR